MSSVKLRTVFFVDSLTDTGSYMSTIVNCYTIMM